MFKLLSELKTEGWKYFFDESVKDYSKGEQVVFEIREIGSDHSSDWCE